MFDDYGKDNLNNEDSGNIPTEENKAEKPMQDELPKSETFDIFSYLKKENPISAEQKPQFETNEQLFETQMKAENTENVQTIPLEAEIPKTEPKEVVVEEQTDYTSNEQPSYFGQSMQFEQPKPENVEQSVQQSYIPKPQVIEQPVKAEEVTVDQPTVNESFNTESESQSSYQPTGTSYIPRPQTVPQNGTSYVPTKKENSFFKKNWMYIALGGVSLLLVVAIIFNIVLVGMMVKKNIGIDSGNPSTSTSQSNGETLDISKSPSTDTAYSTGNTEKLTYAQIAAKVRPSVVSVITYDLASFGQNSGQGSGIIYSSDGYIVTNAHVINNSKTVHVTVVLSDEREFEATVLGFDTRTDLAVLKINATDLPTAEFGESDKLVVGDEVIAIGNPGGEQFAGSTTNGIVSGVDRVIDADSSSTTAMKYIQTNAAINPGNSGGALVNIYGQVIGINTAKISATGYEGLGFAIPIATAKPIIDDLSSLGYVSGRVKIGITCTEVTSSMAQYYNVPTGLLIYSIEQGTELYTKAQVGDIIDKVDGKDISSLSEMQDIFAEKNVGDEVTLEIYRPATSRLQNATTFSVTIHLIEDKGDTQTEYSNGF